ncbi:MAG: SDR family NAD(P)-dependent oxidoreductase [Clostridiales bacterium]|nr:SDR family NAD(P)-dependent oxidoreductase [Clostridiales bacterium]
MGYTLITGACGGLGRAFCKELIKTDDLFIVGRNAQRLHVLKEELLKIRKDAKVEFFEADIAHVSQREKLLEYVDFKEIKFGGVFHVAGADIQKEFIKYTPEKIRFQIRVNFEAAVSLTHEVLKRREKEIKILAVSSICGTVPMPYFALYSATKSALINFFVGLRYELHNAKVTTLIPGSIPTREDIVEDIKKQGVTGKLSSKSPEFVAKKAIKALNKNKPKVITGAFNKFVYFLEKITPTKVKCRYIAKKWSKKEKDAF